MTRVCMRRDAGRGETAANDAAGAEDGQDEAYSGNDEERIGKRGFCVYYFLHYAIRVHVSVSVCKS